MIKIREKETWLYFDVPLLFIGESRSNNLYLCELIKADEDLIYLCVHINNDEIEQLEAKKISLRHVYLSHKSELYTCNIKKFAKYINDDIKEEFSEINDIPF